MADDSVAVHALIVAAGKGLRAGGGLPKQYRLLAGIPVLRRTAALFTEHPAVASVTLVIGAGQDALCREALGPIADACRLVTGGDSRQASVRAGLEALAGEVGDDDIVLIHDGARPFASSALTERVIAGVIDSGATLPGIPLVDTIKQVDADGLVTETVPREPLRRGQTPQGFRFGALLSAHRDQGDAPWATDDSVLMEKLGHAVRIVPGDPGNVKLTTEEDFMEAEARLTPARETRTGMGYDVHRFAEGDHVWLCGVHVPHDRTLAGHSDADVGLHAITDALLGAISAGDIGAHFPPSDPQWKGCESHVFLSHAGKLVQARGGRVVNIDATLICERPKVGPHRQSMQDRVAAILGIEPGRVAIKATTTERLGFTGRQEGIACQAIASVSLPVTEEGPA